MKAKFKLTQKQTKRKASVFQPFQEGYECLLCKPAGCYCSLCIRPQQISLKQTIARPTHQTYETNFEFSVRNAYTFVLMHLKNDDNKNPLGLLIPDICVFYEGVPFDIYYSQNGHIRGYKSTPTQKIRRTQIPKIFKQLFQKASHGVPCKEINFARFINNEYMILSDTDLMQLCFKSRSDPVWPKLEYLYNKLQVQSHQPIIKVFNSLTDYPPMIIKLAAESLVGYISDSEVRDVLDEDSYLDYCNIKICNLLNYKHNIRIIKAEFSYLRTIHGSYIFINADHIEHSNLTQALKKREERIEREQMERNNKILLTPRRQDKIKHMQANPMVKVIENKMNQQFQKQLKQFDFHSEQFSKNEEMRSALAFKKLHPLLSIQYKDLIQSPNFMKIKDVILGKSKRRSLVGKSNTRTFSFIQPVVSNKKYPFGSISRMHSIGSSKETSKIYFNHHRRLTTTTDMSLQSRLLRTEEDRQFYKE